MDVLILQRHFDRFHQNISLDESRRARIDSALSNFRRTVAGDAPLQALTVATVFTQGSFAHSMVVRPTKEDAEYDVDVVLPIDANRRKPYSNPEEILQYVANRLNVYLDYQGKVRKRNRCVRLDYAGDFHFDIVPAHVTGRSDGMLQIPDREKNDWVYTNPAGLTAWLKHTNDVCKGRFTRVAKMLKRWRDVKFGQESAPPSLLLVTLAGYYEPYETKDGRPPIRLRTQESSSDAALVTDIANILKYKLKDLWWVPTVPNPSSTSENFAASWSSAEFDLFRKRIDYLADRCSRAYDEPDERKSIDLWQDAFGSAFPINA